MDEQLLTEDYADGFHVYRRHVPYKKLIALTMLLTMLIASLRLVNLDADLPATGISFSLSIDEGSYSKQSLNYYEYGSWKTSGDYPFDTGDSFKSIVFGNLAQIASMRMFGDTYFAFRLPYVLCGLLAIALTMLMVKRIAVSSFGEAKKSLIVLVVVALVLITDFPLQLCTRVVENSVIRMLGNLIMFYILLLMGKHRVIRDFLLGFWGTICVFFIYFSNITPLLVLLLYGIWLLVRREWKEALSLAAFASFGIALGLALSEFYYQWAWGQGALETMYQGIFAFSRRLEPSGQVKTFFYLNNLMRFFVSNPFFYNPLLLGLFLLSIRNVVKRAVRERDEVAFLSLAFIVAFLMQCMLADDWNQRKAIVVYPFVIICCVIHFTKEANVGNYDLERGVGLNRRGMALTLLVYMSILIYMYWYRWSESFFNDFTIKQLVLCVAVTTLAVFFFTIYLHRTVARTNGVGIRRGVYKPLLTGFLLVLTLSVAFDWKFIYGKPTYSEKTAMQEIGKIIGDNFVANPISYSYLLYNDIKPISNDIEVVKELFKTEDINYMIDYAGSPYSAYNYVESRDDLRLIAEFDRTPTAWGYQKSIGVFEKTFGSK